LFEGLIRAALHEVNAVSGALPGKLVAKGIEGIGVALDITAGEPEAAALTSFDLIQLDLAF
jgi:hypothetical protein